ncbi:MAG: resolvase [Synechococcus sp.]|nr:resolvase [Synechococcus sp.]
MAPGSAAPSAGAGLAGLDPGRSKCGLVRTDPQRRRIEAAAVLPPEQAWAQLEQWCRQGLVEAVVLGNGTGSHAWRDQLSSLVAVELVEERGSTLAARERYWQLFPPRGWRRCLPRGLRQPPRDWDDVVAQLLLERHLGHPLARQGDQKLARTVKA